MNTTKRINKAFKFRVYPNWEQQQVFAKHFGHCRFVYNHFLRERIAFYESNEEKTKGTKKDLTYNDNAIYLTQLIKEVNSKVCKPYSRTINKNGWRCGHWA